MIKKLTKWLDDKYEFTQENFKKNWEKGNSDYKYLLGIWKWIALLAFFAGFTLAAGIYSQKVNDAVQAHIDDVNEYFYQKYGSEYSDYLIDHNMTNKFIGLDLDLDDFNAT